MSRLHNPGTNMFSLFFPLEIKNLWIFDIFMPSRKEIMVGEGGEGVELSQKTNSKEEYPRPTGEGIFDNWVLRS